MSHTCTVLMYHATAAQADELDSADPHYAVGLAMFRDHLAALHDLGLRAQAVEAVPVGPQASTHVGMTFDDGHATNLAAAEALAERGWSGTFFVNPSAVGSHDFLSWAALRDMATAGMSIQSHAQHHRYLDDLSWDAQREEVTRSKAEIEQHLGRPVTVFAPPGGRTTPDVTALARQAGYTMLCNSRVGVWHTQRDSVWDVPRFAVLASTPLHQLRQWAQQAPGEVAKQVLRYRALRLAKRLLGNAGYDRLRGAVLPTPKDY